MDRLGAWRSLVARTVRVGEVPGSNPGAPIPGSPVFTGDPAFFMGAVVPLWFHFVRAACEMTNFAVVRVLSIFSLWTTASGTEASSTGVVGAGDRRGVMTRRVEVAPLAVQGCDLHYVR